MGGLSRVSGHSTRASPVALGHIQAHWLLFCQPCWLLGSHRAESRAQALEPAWDRRPPSGKSSGMFWGQFPGLLPLPAVRVGGEGSPLFSQPSPQGCLPSLRSSLRGCIQNTAVSKHQASTLSLMLETGRRGRRGPTSDAHTGLWAQQATNLFPGLPSWSGWARGSA